MSEDDIDDFLMAGGLDDDNADGDDNGDDDNGRGVGDEKVANEELDEARVDSAVFQSGHLRRNVAKRKRDLIAEQLWQHCRIVTD